MSWRGLAKRLKSPTSAATVTATIWPTPRIAWSACTTGASDQQGSKAMICSASPRHPLRGILDGVEVVLQHDLLGGMREAQRRQPPPIGQGPRRSAGIMAAVPQQKALQVLTRLAQHPHRGGSGTDQIAHCLVCRIRHPNGREL